MSVYLSRDQYYRNQDLQNLFSSLGIESREVISQKFDDILKLVRSIYKKLSLKYHPDRNKGNEKQAEEKFKRLCADKSKLEEYINTLKAGKSLSRYRKLSEREIIARHRKAHEILSRKSAVMYKAYSYFLLANIVFDPSLEVEFCLSQFAASGKVK